MGRDLSSKLDATIHCTPQYHTFRVSRWFLGSLHQKVSEFSLMMKEFCGGKAGWNDRAIFIETDLVPASNAEADASLGFSNLWHKQSQNALPSALSDIQLSLRS